MELQQYWNLEPVRREGERRAARRAELEEQAEERRMLIHEGKLIKPEEYPCTCEWQSPSDCYAARKPGMPHGLCRCPCHTYCEPL